MPKGKMSTAPSGGAQKGLSELAYTDDDGEIGLVLINKTGTIGRNDTAKIRKLQLSIAQSESYTAPDAVVSTLRRKNKKQALAAAAGEITIDDPKKVSNVKDAPAANVNNQGQGQPAQSDQKAENSKSQSPNGALPYQETNNNVKSVESSKGYSESSQFRGTEHLYADTSILPGAIGTYAEDLNMPDLDFLPDDFDFTDDISQYKFREYAEQNFQGGISHHYEQILLKDPLLPLEGIGDVIAALAVWITLLRFMEDIEDNKKEESSMDKLPMMVKIYQTLGHKYSDNDLQAARSMEVTWRGNNSKSSPDAKISKEKKQKGGKVLGRFRKSKPGGSSGEGIKFSSYDEKGNPMLENRKWTDLEKVHFIVGSGLLRPHLRDEILCQICKQLTDNPSAESRHRGWVMLSVCLSCFAPSLDFLNFLCCFIDEGSETFAEYCANKLDRTLMNGPRKEPPTWLELQSAITTDTRRLLTLPIILTDGNTKTVLVDSAVTASELCKHISEKVGIKDKVGFSIFIALGDKVMSLGSGSEHVFDAIGQAEQISREMGTREGDCRWKIFFRKETFTPWYDAKEDAVATNLIYHQILRGIRYGEYPCKEEDLVMVTATQYYVDFGRELIEGRLRNMLPLYLPSKYTKEDKLNDWVRKISLAHSSCNYVKRDMPVSRAKADVVGYAKHKWPMAFTTFFEAYKYAGPSLAVNDVVIGINAKGVFIFTYDGKLMIHWLFPEISTAYNSRSGKIHGQSITLATIHNEEFTFTSPDATHVKRLISLFLKGLRKRSRYVMALENTKKSGNPSFLASMRGDVIKLDREYDKVLLNSGWCNAENLRTHVRGEFRAECVFVLPTMKEPTRKLMQAVAAYVTSQPVELIKSQDQAKKETEADKTQLKGPRQAVSVA